jgi:hypothetical protein
LLLIAAEKDEGEGILCSTPNKENDSKKEPIFQEDKVDDILKEMKEAQNSIKEKSYAEENNESFVVKKGNLALARMQQKNELNTLPMYPNYYVDEED